MKWLSCMWIVAAALATGACTPHVEDDDPAVLATGNSARGAAHFRAYGCGTCHQLSGVPGADGLVGPPLDGLVRRSYVGGVLTNTPEHLAQWIVDPKSFSPKTAMPAVGVNLGDARDIAAYLYSRR